MHTRPTLLSLHIFPPKHRSRVFAPRTLRLEITRLGARPRYV